MNLIKLALNIHFQKKEPISLIHFITHRCNARCKHCFIDFDTKALFNNELSLAEIEQLTKNLGSSLCNVNLTGGEPFLRSDIFEIVSLYCRNTSVEIINIATNGMYTDAVGTLLDKFRKSKFKKKLMFSISIDNFESLHDNNRNVKGLFENAIKTYKLIESYKDKQIVATIAITITPYNYENVMPLYNHLKNIGIKSFFAILMRKEGVIRNVDEKKEILDAYGKLTNLITTDQRKGRTVGMGDDLKGSYLKARTNLINRILCRTYLTKKFICYCSAGALFGVLYANGDVFPCEVLNDYNLGNIRDYHMDFMKLWNSNKVRECREYIKRSRCSCTFECACSVNIISNIKFIPRLFFYLWKNIKWKRKK
jgi:MoaA/NifB/PqqE/SkfB family radical SAM enzyme